MGLRIRTQAAALRLLRIKQSHQNNICKGDALLSEGYRVTGIQEDDESSSVPRLRLISGQTPNEGRGGRRLAEAMREVTVSATNGRSTRMGECHEFSALAHELVQQMLDFKVEGSSPTWNEKYEALSMSLLR